MKNQKARSIYGQMQRLANLTKQFIVSGKMLRAQKCLKTAEFLFRYGNTEIRNAISNVFIFSITSFLEMNQYRVRNLLPKNLLGEHQQQINASGT